MQIRSGKWCNTVHQKNAVYDSQKQPENGNHNSPEAPPVKQINDQHCSKNKHRIISKYQRFSRHIIPGLHYRVAAQCLYKEIEHCAPECLENQGNLIAKFAQLHAKSPFYLLSCSSCTSQASPSLHQPWQQEPYLRNLDYSAFPHSGRFP